MKFNEIDQKYGRHFLIASVILGWVILGGLFINYGYYRTWKLWGVRPEKPPFVDFRLIPGSADTFRAGIDPAVTNPYDPRQRVFNYPKIWYLLFYTGISQDDTIWISVTMLVLFFGSLLLLPGEIRVRDALLMIVVIFSPASMLLYERGNVDLIIFVLCALIIFTSETWPWLTVGLITFGALVKMFPFFGLTVLWKKSRGFWFRAFLVSFAILFVYMILTLSNVKASWSQTMRGPDLSYGTNVLFTFFEPNIRQMLSGIPSVLADFIYKYVPPAFALLLLLRVFLAVKSQPKALTSNSQRNLDLFRMGAVVYIGTFLLGNSWDYRLAFMVLVTPQLAQWISVEAKQYRVASTWALITTLLSCWYIFFRMIAESINAQAMLFLYLFDEITNWVLFASLFYLLIASAPDWLRNFKLKDLLDPRKLLANDSA